MSGFRLQSGGRIDRTKPINFTFNGRVYQAFEGDTLASALLANGCDTTARSFKYHRPRGIVSAGIEEPGTFVEMYGQDASANEPATTVKVSPGIKAKTVNCWPSPGIDLGAVNQMFSTLLPAGFYYKTFTWPNWKLYEQGIRRAAGLAAAPGIEESKETYESRDWHCDLLIVGGGPAGLATAVNASNSGARIVLCDSNDEFGGSLLDRPKRIGDRLAAKLVGLRGVRTSEDGQRCLAEPSNSVGLSRA